jgi:ATP-dependent protease HslVU (ClpYQ) peptidase subunit
MSVIVGIKHQGITYLGTDSQMTKGSVKKHYTHIDNRKIWRPDDVSHLLLGGVGILKGLNEVKHINGLIDPLTLRTDRIDTAYVFQHIIPRIVYRMEEHKLVENKDFNPKMQNEFLFANKGELYHLNYDGSIITIDDYAAIGSGSIEAIGSLLSTEGEDPVIRIKKAIKAAIEHDIYVDYPIFIMNTHDDTVIQIKQ